MPATLSSSYGGGRKIAGRVNYIQPQVDPMTRTLKIRIDADNPGLALKPDMFVDVEFHTAMARRVTVPIEAVLDAGMRKTVFVDRGNGYLEPRQVETGDRAGERIEILKGLKAGERVVISGNFLIDSESQLNSAASGMSSMPGMPGMDDKKPDQPAKQDDMPGMPGMPSIDDHSKRGGAKKP
jgi:Cu(I)/Ag(I) efflux system membrane fusion protein